MPTSLRSPLFGLLVALVVVAGFSLTTMQTAMSQVPSEPPGSPGTGEVETDRLGGQTRFETAVEISQESFPAGSEDVFLARADDFADALAGSSLTTTGPILLVPSCGDVPDVVLDEIERLSPNRVVALGGENAVCEDVLDQAQEAAQQGDGSETPSEDPSESETPVPSESPTECPSPNPLPIGEECPSPEPSPTVSPTATETPPAPQR